MRKFIIIWLLFACVLSFDDRRQLPYGGAILRPNGKLIPGKFYSTLFLFSKTEFYLSIVTFQVQLHVFGRNYLKICIMIMLIDVVLLSFKI